MKLLAGILILCLGTQAFESSFSLEHGLEDSTMHDRGDVILTSNENSKLKLSFSEKTASLPLKDLVTGIVANKQYAVRMHLPEYDSYIFSQISLCEIARTNFQLSFYFDVTKSGELLSFQLAPYKQKSARVKDEHNCNDAVSRKALADKIEKAELTVFRHTAAVSLPKVVSTPESSEFNSFPTEASKEYFTDNQVNEDNEDKGEQQSFLRRYWYIFLPMFIMSFLSPPPPEEQQQQSKNNKKKN